MKTSNLTRMPFRRVIALALTSFCAASLQAELITQTVNENSTAFPGGWNLAVWGTPADFPTSGNDYLIPSGFTCRTPNATTNSTFGGNILINTNGGTLAIKHSGGIATANLIFGPGTLSHSGGSGSTGVAPSPLAGTLLAAGNINYSGSATGNPQPRHLTLLSTLLGSGNFNIGNCYTSSVYLANNGVDYTGTWNVTGGRLVILGGTAPLGSGTVNLANSTNTLTFNCTNDVVFTNNVIGLGRVVQGGPNTVVFASDFSTFDGSLAVTNGTALVTGNGAKTTVIDDDGILLVSSATTIPSGSLLQIQCNNPDRGRLELSNSVTISTGIGIDVSMRNTNYVAIKSASGNNVILDPIVIQPGGGFLGLEAAAGATLSLASVTSGGTGTRNFTLLGDGNGTVTEMIDNGVASSVTLNKSGAGTWTLEGYNIYTGSTYVESGTLKLGASGSIGGSPAIGIEQNGKFDVSQVSGGFILAPNQVLRGNGAVLGNVTTSFGSLIEVGFYNQYGDLSLSNNLVFSGGETNRFEVGGSNDVLNVAGSITLNGETVILVASPEGSIENGTYRLINYSGTLQGAGFFTLVPPPTRQTFTLVTTTPGRVDLVVTGNPITLTWSGDGFLNWWDIGTTANWNSQMEVFYNGDSVVFSDAGSATPDIEVVTPVQVGSMLVNNSAKSFTFTNSPITSLGNLTKQGDNVLALANNCNFQGVTIEAGTLSIGNGGDTGTLSTGAITNNGELLVNHLTTGVTLAGNISGSGSVRIAPGSDTAHPTLTLRGTNSYTGLTTVETNSAITIQSETALGNTSTGTRVLAGGRAGFTSLGPWTNAEPLEINGDGLWDFPGALYVNTASNLVDWTGPITVGSAARIRVVNNYAKLILNNSVIGNQTPLRLTSEGTGAQMILNDTLSIGDEAVLTKDGSGAVILAGNNNLCGSTVIDSGSLVIATTTSPTIGDITVNGGILQIGDGGSNWSLPTGVISLAGTATGSWFRFHITDDFTIDRELFFGSGGFSKYNSNTVVILNSNSFSGNIETGSGSPGPNGRGAGIIELHNSHGLGDEFAFKTIQLIRAELQLIGGLTLPAGHSYEISGGSFVNSEGPGLIPIRSMSGNNAIQGNIALIGGAGSGEISVDSGTLTINGNITANATGRTLWLSGAGNGILNGGLMNNGANIPSLIKQGSGTWTLNAYNDYSGNTTIQGGTLTLGAAASIGSTPLITLLSNAVLNVSAVPGGLSLVSQNLRGNGTVQGDVTSFATVSPGTSVGTLNVTGTLTLYGDTVMELDRSASPNADLLKAASIVCGGTLTINNIGPALQPGDSFNLFDGPFSGEFGVTNLPALPSTDYFWDLSQFASQGIISVGSTVAPPPTILPPSITGSDLVLTVNSVAGFTYNLEATPAVSPASWSVIQSKSGGGLLTFTIPITPGVNQRFFRITVQ